MKIFFRYLFMRLFVPFMVCIAACTLIWIMVDLYGNIDDFLEHKAGLLVVLRFYALQIPSMLVQVLPAALCFSTLWTLLSLNRRSELVAFQSGGMAPVWLFSPFFVFAVIWVLVLFGDLLYPAPKSQVTRDRLLSQVKGQSAKYNVFVNLPYDDKVNRRIWFFQSLDLNQNTAKGVDLLLKDASGRDVMKYFATSAEWTGTFWRLRRVQVKNYSTGDELQNQKIYEQLDLNDVNTPPSLIGLVKAQPEELTVRELSEFLNGSTASSDYLAKYRTEWWYRVIYPFSLIVLMFFALLQGTSTDRRSTLGGIMTVIIVLIAFIAVTQMFLAAGRVNRLPAFVAVSMTPVVFGAIGLFLLGRKNGWGWQILEHYRRFKALWDENRKLPGA